MYEVSNQKLILPYITHLKWLPILGTKHIRSVHLEQDWD